MTDLATDIEWQWWVQLKKSTKNARIKDDKLRERLEARAEHEKLKSSPQAPIKGSDEKETTMINPIKAVGNFASNTLQNLATSAPELTPERMDQIRAVTAVSGAMRIPGDEKTPESLRLTLHPIVIHHEKSNTNRLIPPLSFTIHVRNSSWGWSQSPQVVAEGSIKTPQGALHPHIHNQQGNPCWGEAAAHLNQSVKMGDWLMMVNIIAMWAANSKQLGGYEQTLSFFPVTDLKPGYVTDQELWAVERERLNEWEKEQRLLTQIRTLPGVYRFEAIDETHSLVHFKDVSLEDQSANTTYTKDYLVPSVICYLTKRENGWFPIFSQNFADPERKVCHPALTSLFGTEDWDVQYADQLEKAQSLTDAISVISAYLSDSNAADPALLRTFSTTYSGKGWRGHRTQGSPAWNGSSKPRRIKKARSIGIRNGVLAHGLVKDVSLEVESHDARLTLTCESGIDLNFRLNPLEVRYKGRKVNLNSRTQKNLNKALEAKDWLRLADILTSWAKTRRPKKG